MVGGDLGAVSLRLVLVGALDLGHDVYAASPGLSIFACIGIAGMARATRLGALRRTLRSWGPGQSHDAGLPALLRPLDLAAAIPAWAVFSRSRRAGFRRVFSGADSLAGAEL